MIIARWNTDFKIMKNNVYITEKEVNCKQQKTDMEQDMKGKTT